MIDFGIVALLVLQIAALIGTVVAWFGIRKEADSIVRGYSETNRDLSAMESDLGGIRLAVSGYEARLSGLESDIGKAVRAAENSRDMDAVNKAEFRSLKAAITAMKRWNRDEADGATVDPPTPEPAYQPDPLPTGKNGTFGVKAA